MKNTQEKQPNILLILADDMGYSDIGCFGGEIQTPVLDALARQGVRFSQMYNMARCCPSRACLLTGLYPHQAGVGHMTGDMGSPAYRGYLNDRCVTVAEALRAAGYQTGMVGKWHVGGDYGRSKDPAQVAGTPGYPTPLQRGFDRFFGTLEGAADYYNPITLMDGDTPVTLQEDDDFYYTEAIGQRAARMIDDFMQQEAPFFLYMAFTAPHWPLHAHEQDIQRYEGKYLDGWDAARQARYRRMVEMGIIEDQWRLSPRDEDAPQWDDVGDKAFEDIKMAVYAAQVTAMDRAVGEAVARLAAHGAMEDTLILFLSDNGGCAEVLPGEGWVRDFARDTTRDGRPVEVGNASRRRPGGEDTYMSYGLPWANVSNTPFRLFKHWIHEGGIASPLIAHWPRGFCGDGRIVHTPVHFVDVLPTLLEAAGAAYPAQLDGRVRIPLAGESFLPAMSRPWQRNAPIFWEHEGNCGVRMGRYKLVRKFPGPYELYDIERDRTELHDLAAALPEQVAVMGQAYDAWAEEVGVRAWKA